jgi:hypothetical protein
MKRRKALVLLVMAALLLPSMLTPTSQAVSRDNPKLMRLLTRPVAAHPTSAAQNLTKRPDEIDPAILKALGISHLTENIDPKEAGKKIAQILTGDPNGEMTQLPPAVPGTNNHPIKAPAGAGKSAQTLTGKSSGGANRLEPEPGTNLVGTGLPSVLNVTSALSASLITTLGGINTQQSEVSLLADWDGREDMTADRGATVDDFSSAPPPALNFTLTRSAISEHTFANGHNFNSYYYGDSLGNLYFGFDLVGNSLVDTTFTVNIPAMINTGSNNGFTLLNPTAGDCSDAQAIVTGIAVNPVADLGDFDSSLCDTTGEVIYVSTLEAGGCATNGAGQPIRTRIFAFAIFEIGGTEFVNGNVIQIARTAPVNLAGLAVDDDGSLYFQLLDLAPVDPSTGIGGSGGAIFKATERPRTLCATTGRINRVITSIPGLTGSSSGILTQPTPIANANVRLTNYSGPSTVFGNIVSLTAGPNNAIYAAVAASNTGTGDPTQGLFKAPASFPDGLPSMIMTLVDATGGFNSCSAPAPGLQGIVPIADGVADPAGPGTAIRWRAFVLGNGPDIRTSTAPLSSVTGTTANTLKLDMQVDYTTYNGIAVNEEGSVFVISGGTPPSVGNNPSPNRTEILGFEDKNTADRRADYVDFRGNNVPTPPASGGNVGDGDSDRFDHIYYQAPTDPITFKPVGLAGLARGFLRYTNRMVGTNAAAGTLGPGVTLGASTGVQGDDDTTGTIIFENLDPGHQVAGGDDQNTPFRGDDDGGQGTPLNTGALNGGFEFSFGGPVGTAGSVWNGFFLNSNGNITFGAGDTDNTPTVLELRSTTPRLAPAWADMNPAARADNLGTFPVQALGFASVNAFKVRWINVPEFGSENCSGRVDGASNTFSVTLYDDGRGIDENASQPLNPANPIGNNSVPFDLQEGPNDLRFVPSPTAGASLVGEPLRPDGSGIFIFDYGRMDLLGTDAQQVITGYSIGNLDPLNPPGLCEVNLSEVARAADASPFGVLPGNQIASIKPNLIGEGTEPTIYELFNSGADPSIGAGGEHLFGRPDFDLRFEGNDPAATKPATQIDNNRERIGFFGLGGGPPAPPIIQQIIAIPSAFTPDSGPDLIDALGGVDVYLVGSGFFPNEVTQLCEGAGPEPGTGVPTPRPGKTVTSVAQIAIDDNGDAIPEATFLVGNVTPISKNLVSARLTPLVTAPGTPFPFSTSGGQATITLTTTFSGGDNNVFGPFTRTAVGSLTTGKRAPVVLGVTSTAGDCSVSQDLLISGASFIESGGPVSDVFAVEDGNPANIIHATSFSVVDNNTITARFNFGGPNFGKKFLIFVTGPGGTSRNITPTLPAGTPSGVPLGNEQGNLVEFACIDATFAGPPKVQLSSSSFTVNEGAGHATVTINRTGDVTAPASVQYSTSDLSGLTNCDVVTGNASQRCDYTGVGGTLNFSGGQISASFDIPIIDDVYVEGPETLTITLSNAVGGSVVTPATATLTITDNDVAPGAANPIDDDTFFIRQQYLDILGREPDPPGLAGWQAFLSSCAVGSTACDRIELSSRFFRSEEFFDRAYFIYRFYETALGRKPTYDEYRNDFAKVAGFLTPAELETRKAAFAEEFSQRPEFKAKYDSKANGDEYVNAIVATAGVVPSNRTDVSIREGALLISRGRALRELLESPEISARFFNEAFVVIGYFAYLRREPDAQYLVWLDQLNTTGNYRDMIGGFIGSQEYRRRFGPN